MTTTRTVRILDPVPEEEAAPRLHPTGRPAALSGLVVGFLDNGQKNSDAFLARLGERLRADAGVAEIVHRRKAYWTKRADPETVDELAQTCDVVISAWGS